MNNRYGDSSLRFTRFEMLNSGDLNILTASLLGRIASCYTSRYNRERAPTAPHALFSRPRGAGKFVRSLFEQQYAALFCEASIIVGDGSSLAVYVCWHLQLVVPGMCYLE